MTLLRRLHAPVLVAVAVSLATAGVLSAACSSQDATASGALSSTVPSTASETTAETVGEDSDTSVSDTAPVPSAGCAAAAAEPTREQKVTLEVDGTPRWYLITVPASAMGDPAPLVFDFHGLSEGAEFHAVGTRYSDLAETEGFVVAFPQGLGSPVRWSIDASGESADIQFVDAMIEQITAEHCIDESRIYSTGLSNGALLSSVLGCARSDRFAAVAPVSGVAFPEDCDPSEPVPVLTFHGTLDPILLFNGSVGSALSEALAGRPLTPTSLPEPDLNGEGYPAAAAAWAEANGCSHPVDTQYSDSIVHRVWDCPDGADVEFFIVMGGGHTWPGSDALASDALKPLVGETTFEIDATTASWEFLRRFSRS